MSDRWAVSHVEDWCRIFPKKFSTNVLLFTLQSNWLPREVIITVVQIRYISQQYGLDLHTIFSIQRLQSIMLNLEIAIVAQFCQFVGSLAHKVSGADVYLWKSSCVYSELKARPRWTVARFASSHRRVQWDWNGISVLHAKSRPWKVNSCFSTTCGSRDRAAKHKNAKVRQESLSVFDRITVFPLAPVPKILLKPQYVVPSSLPHRLSSLYLEIRARPAHHLKRRGLH